MVEITVIRPEVDNIAALLKQAETEALAEAGLAIHAAFLDQVDTWEHQPEFTVAQDDHSVTVATTDTNFIRIDEGVEGRTIVPRPGNKALRIWGRYEPKSQAYGQLFAARMAGQGIQDDPIIVKKVNWPGIKPRKFAEKLAFLIDEGASGLDIQAIFDKVFERVFK